MIWKLNTRWNEGRIICSEAWYLLRLEKSTKTENQYLCANWNINMKYLKLLLQLHKLLCVSLCLSEIHVMHSYTTKYNDSVAVHNCMQLHNCNCLVNINQQNFNLKIICCSWIQNLSIWTIFTWEHSKVIFSKLQYCVQECW